MASDEEILAANYSRLKLKKAALAKGNMQLMELLGNSGAQQETLGPMLARLPAAIFEDIDGLMNPNDATDLLAKFVVTAERGRRAVVDAARSVVARESLTREQSPQPRPQRAAAAQSLNMVKRIVAEEKNDSVVEKKAPEPPRAAKGATKNEPSEDNESDDNEDDRTSVGSRVSQKRETDAQRTARKAKEEEAEEREGFRHPAVLFCVENCRCNLASPKPLSRNRTNSQRNWPRNSSIYSFLLPKTKTTHLQAMALLPLLPLRLRLRLITSPPEGGNVHVFATSYSLVISAFGKDAIRLSSTSSPDHSNSQCSFSQCSIFSNLSRSTDH